MQLNTPGRRALYNNLSQQTPLGGAGVSAESRGSFRNPTNDEVLELAIKIDETVKRTRQDGWRGVQTREQGIKRALYEVLQSNAEVERIFLIITQQKEY